MSSLPVNNLKVSRESVWNPINVTFVGSLIWVLFVLAGSDGSRFSNQIVIDSQIAFVLIAFCYIVLHHMVVNKTTLSYSKFNYIRVLWFISLIVISSISAVLAGEVALKSTGVMLLVVFGSGLFAQMPPEFAARTFTNAVVFLIGVSFTAYIFNRDVRFFASGYTFNPLDYRFQGILSHPNLLGLLCCLASVLSFSFKMSIFKTLITTTCLVVTEFRIGIFSILLVFLVIQLLHYKETRIHGFTLSVARVTVMLFALGVLVLTSFFVMLRPRSNSSDVLTGRSAIWEFCREAANLGGFWGHGPEYLWRTLGQSSISSIQVSSCHNQFLDDYVNFGILYAFVLTIGLVIRILKAWISLEATVLSVLICVVIIGATETVIRFWTILQYSWMLPLLSALFFSRPAPTDSGSFIKH